MRTRYRLTEGIKNPHRHGILDRMSAGKQLLNNLINDEISLSVVTWALRKKRKKTKEKGNKLGGALAYQPEVERG